MMDNGKKWSDRLDAILEGIAESASDSTEEVLEKFLRDEGRNPDKVVAEMRALFSAIDKKVRRRKLTAAGVAHQERVQRMRQTIAAIPTSISARRDLLFNILHNNPAYSEGLTLRHREFKEITDDEVDSYLRQLIELGIDIPDPDGSEGK